MDSEREEVPVRERYTRRDPSPADPDLVPVMSLACLLVPLLLMSSTFTQLSVIDMTLPGF